MSRIRASLLARFAVASALLANSGCGTGSTWRQRLGAGDGGSGDGPLGSAWSATAPTVSAVSVARDGHDLAIRLTLAGDGGIPRPALTGATSGRDGWTFQLAFDTDHDRRSGDATGAELAAVVDARGAVALLAWSRDGWSRVAGAPIEERGGSISFRLDATRFASALEGAVVTAETYQVAASGDGGTEVVPVGSMRSGGDGVPVPAMTRLRSEVRGDTLFVRGQFAVSEHGEFYDPLKPGGWMLQMLLDTAQDGVGYWRGYDYIVRGGEWSGGGFTVRRITLDDSTPGGWGPASGHARFRLSPRHFELAIPLAALGDDDGRADYVLETYRIVACPACLGGVSQQYTADYFGVSGGRLAHHGAVRLPAGLDAVRLGVAAPPSLSAVR